MLFGFTNVPATFQNIIDYVLRRFLGVFVVVYLDDILIYSKSLEEHKQHVRQVLQTLQDHNLYVNPVKSHFYKQGIDFIGYIIRPNEVRMQKSKIQAIKKWIRPINLRKIRGFLGFTNYYRMFIRDYRNTISELTKLTRKDIPFT
jgi:hypothetical protein